MKLIPLLLIGLLLSGCGYVNRTVATVTGEEEVCVDGVSYLQFPSGVTVKYQRDGFIATCDESEEK